MTRWLLRLAGVAGIALASPPVVLADGLTLLLDLGVRPLRVEAAFRGSTPPEALRPRRIGDGLAGYLESEPSRQARLIGFHGPSGAVLALYGLAAGPTRFGERLDPQSGMLTREPVMGDDRRLVQVAVPDQASLLAVFDASLDPAPSGLEVAPGTRPNVVLAAVYALGHAMLSPSELRLPEGVVVSLPAMPPQLPVDPTPFEGVTTPPVTLIAGHGDTGGFDLVVLGDGFTSADMPVLRHRVRDFALRLLGDPGRPNDYPGMSPFSDQDLRARVNVWLVEAVSKNHGITNCPCCAGDEDTYFGVRGNFSGLLGSPVDFGTDQEGRIFDTARLVSPRRDLAELEAFLVVLNCAEYGGRGFRDRRLAYVPLIQDAAEFADLAIHELAHAIADLGDEYLSCDPESTIPRRLLNVATPRQMQRDDVWWAALAVEAEGEVSHGRLLVREECGITLPVAMADRLGLFWGAQFIAATGKPCTCEPGDSRQCGYYRAQSTCKMREIDQGFCRACRCVLRHAILGKVFSPTDVTECR